MTLTLSDLAADAASRRTQLTQIAGPPNPPSWISFTSTGSGFQVMLNPPVTNSGAPYLGQGAGLNFPMTNARSTSYAPVFYFQCQIATDAGFTQNVQTFDMGTSTSYTIPLATGAAYAQARARFVNSAFSQWQPFGSQVAGATFRPIIFTVGSLGGSVSNPFEGMDGDTTTAAVVTGPDNVIYGPFYSPANLTNSLTLTVISAATEVGGVTDSTVSYSVDAGQSYTTIRNTAGGWSKTTDTVTLPTNFNLGLLRVQGEALSSGDTVSIYETYVQ